MARATCVTFIEFWPLSLAFELNSLAKDPNLTRPKNLSYNQHRYLDPFGRDIKFRREIAVAVRSPKP